MVSSAVALEALLEAGDDRLLAAVLDTHETKLLRGLAAKWYGDARAPVRRLLLEYIDDGLLRPHHQPLAKAIFKRAEAAKDHEAMAHLLVACDRMARRRLVNRGRYDWQTRTYHEWKAVVPEAGIPRTAPTRKTKPINGRCPPVPDRTFRDPWTGKMVTKSRSHLPTFTFRTRRYLARRAWRYFRTLAKEDPRGYRDAITLALSLYDDAHLQDAMALLDSWGLVHALYHHSPLLAPDRPGWVVKPGCAFAEVTFAPYLPEVWQEEPEPLFDLVARARARTVRLFALEQLRTHHAAALERVDIERARRFMTSPHEEVLVFGSELFRNAEGLELLSIEQWRALLAIHNPYATPSIVAAFERAVTPDRLDDDALVDLARTPNALAARLALQWLKGRPVEAAPDLERRLRLVDASADAVRTDAASWLAQLIADSPFATPLHARAMLDAHHRDVRAAGVQLLRDAPRLGADPGLWVAMSETPYDDIRMALLERLDHAEASLEADAMQRVWAAVLLAIHRGSRAKVRAAKQIAARLVAEPARAEELLPLVAVSMRSLRRPERRTALAMVARAVFAHPSLADKVQAALPGLQVGGSER